MVDAVARFASPHGRDQFWALNYGLDRVRFVSPVHFGDRIKPTFETVVVTPKDEGYNLLRRCTFHVEGAARPRRRSQSPPSSQRVKPAREDESACSGIQCPGRTPVKIFDHCIDLAVKGWCRSLISQHERIEATVERTTSRPQRLGWRRTRRRERPAVGGPRRRTGGRLRRRLPLRTRIPNVAVPSPSDRSHPCLDRAHKQRIAPMHKANRPRAAAPSQSRAGHLIADVPRKRHSGPTADGDVAFRRGGRSRPRR